MPSRKKRFSPAPPPRTSTSLRLPVLIVSTPGVDCTTFEMSRLAPGVRSISSVPTRRSETGDSTVATSGDELTTISSTSISIGSSSASTVAGADAVTRTDGVTTAEKPSASM